MSIWQNTKPSKMHGFTLVELLAALAVVGVIATLAMPRYRAQVARARQGEATSNLGTIYKLQKIYATESELDYSPPRTPARHAGLNYGLDKCGETLSERLNGLGFRLTDCSKSRYRYITNAGNDCAKSDGNLNRGKIYPGCTANDEWQMSSTGRLANTHDVIKSCPGGGSAPPSGCVAVALPVALSPPALAPPTTSPTSPPAPPFIPAPPLVTPPPPIIPAPAPVPPAPPPSPSPAPAPVPLAPPSSPSLPTPTPTPSPTTPPNPAVCIVWLSSGTVSDANASYSCSGVGSCSATTYYGVRYAVNCSLEKTDHGSFRIPVDKCNCSISEHNECQSDVGAGVAGTLRSSHLLNICASGSRSTSSSSEEIRASSCYAKWEQNRCTITVHFN